MPSSGDGSLLQRAGSAENGEGLVAKGDSAVGASCSALGDLTGEQKPSAQGARLQLARSGDAQASGV